MSHYWDNDSQGKQRCFSALRAIMSYRGVSSAELAEAANIPQTTIQQYMCGRIDLRSTAALNLITIASALNCDPRILLGLEPLTNFFAQEEHQWISNNNTSEIR